MAFFDNKPRSASAKAMISSEVFELPFAALQEQLNTCPAWLKVMTKTINTQLRDANIRIKNLENIVSDTKDKLMPHMLLRVCAVADLLCYKAETDENENKVFPYKELYNVLVQVFHQNKQKINKALKALKALNLLDIIENDDGQMIVVHDQHTIYDFTIWFQENLAKESGKQVAVEEKDLPNLHILAFYGQNEEIAAEVSDGIVKVHVDHIQKNSKLDLSLNFPPTCIDGLMKKGVIFEKQADDVGVWISYDAVEVTKLLIIGRLFTPSTTLTKVHNYFYEKNFISYFYIFLITVYFRLVFCRRRDLIDNNPSGLQHEYRRRTATT